MQINPVVMVIGIFALTFVYLGIHVVGLVRFLKGVDVQPRPSKLAVTAWIVSFASGFAGPLVVLGNMVAFVMAVIVLSRIRRGEAPPSSKVPAQTALAASLTIIIMGAYAITMALLMPHFA